MSGQGVDLVVLDPSRSFASPIPSVLATVLHESLEPARCPGKVLTQWSSILSFANSLSPGHCVARIPGACAVSGQGVDLVVLDPSRSFASPIPSVLATVLHESLEPARCPGKVLTQWSSILSFANSLSPGHCVARNPGACAVSGQGVDPVVLDPFLRQFPQSWPLCCTNPWSAVSGQGVDLVVLDPSRSFASPIPSVLATVLHESLEPARCPGKVLTQWSSILSFANSLSPGHCVARIPGACAVSGQGVDLVVLDPSRSFASPIPSVLATVLHESLEPARCPGKVLTQWSSILSFANSLSPGHCVARFPGACAVSGQGVDLVVLDPSRSFASPIPSVLATVLHESLEPARCPGKVLTQWSSILSFANSLSPGHCVARNPGACAVSGQGVDPVVLDPFLRQFPQSWPLCCTNPWSLRGVRARC